MHFFDRNYVVRLRPIVLGIFFSMFLSVFRKLLFTISVYTENVQIERVSDDV